MDQRATGFVVMGSLPLPGSDADTQTKIIRLCICLNVLHTLHHHLNSILEDHPNASTTDAHAFAGHRLVTMLMIIGALKEGTDAIRDAGSTITTMVNRSVKAGVDRSPLKEAHARLRKAIDSSDCRSFAERVLSKVRDNAGFHWNRNAIQKACEAAASSTVSFVVHEDGARASHRYVFADEVLGQVAFGSDGTKGIVALLAELRQLVTDILLVCETAVAMFLREHKCVQEPLAGVEEKT